MTSWRILDNALRNVLGNVVINDVAALVRSRELGRMIVMRGYANASLDLVAPKNEVERYITDCLVKVGASKNDAATVAEHLFVADYRGHFSHGMNRMEMYARDIQSGLTDARARPEIVNDFQAIGMVDGRNALGQVVGKFCMNLAVEKAKAFGIGMVACKGSNHYGIAGYYSLMAMREKMIGFSCTNTSPLMAPTRSRKAALGTNPISVGIGAQKDEFVLDMATTCVALGKIELAIRKDESIPLGWAQGPDGKTTTDGSVAYETSCLMPLGGEETNSGYKGYGLALMVEILCGVLTGSKFGPNIRKWKEGGKIADLGHCFMAMDPSRFGSGTEDRLEKLLGQLRELPKAGDRAVLVPGDPEREHMNKVDRDGGLTYHQNQLAASEAFAREMGVEPMRLIERNRV